MKAEGIIESDDAKGLHRPGLENELAERCQGQLAFLRHRLNEVPRDPSSDWDLAVRDTGEVKGQLVQLFGVPRLTIRRTYVEQRFYPWGQVDFLPCFHWNGFSFLSPKRFWGAVQVADDGLPRPRLAHDALIAWMTGLLANGTCNPKYHELITQSVAADGAELKECLIEALGQKTGTLLWNLAEQGSFLESSRSVALVRRSLMISCLLKQPTDTILGVLRHWACELKHHLNPPFPWIAILGPDGSGKSTLIAELQAQFAQTRLKSQLVHWCPRWGEDDARDGEAVTDPHGKKVRGFLLSHAALVYLSLRWLFARMGKIWHRRAKNRLLFSDRHFEDLLVDPKRYRFGGSLKVAELFFRTLPKPDLTVILHGDPQRIFERKQEVPFLELERQMIAYEELSRTLSQKGRQVSLVRCDRPVAEVLAEVHGELNRKIFGNHEN